MSGQIKLKEREWKKLLDKIEKEEVILILGDELSTLNIDGKSKLLKDYLLDRLVEALNEDETDTSKLISREDVKSFSDLSYDYKRERWQKIKSDPYSETIEIISNIPSTLYEKTTLTKLLSIDKFKTIITTSFDDGISNILKGIYGNSSVLEIGYRVSTKMEDIPDKSDKRLLYHLFGRPERVQHSFVLTEDDLLDFIHCLMDQDRRPVKLFHKLADKYLLIVGCSYPDWLFRFFFHSLKYAPSLNGNGRDNGLLADRDLDRELISFLRRMETSVHENAIDFIDELYDRWQNRNHSISETSSVAASDGIEAFISYAKEDYDTAVAIANMFEKLGLKVWFDENKLESGDKYETLIKNKITNVNLKAFIPILSHNTENSGGRFFRKEWKWAKDADEGHFGTNDQFIRPILINGFKMYQEHVFNDCQYVDLTDPNIWENEIRRIVRSIRKY